MNVLLSSVGRRSYLVRYFQEALAGQGKVIATNLIANTTGMQAADEAFVMPPIANPTYTERVIDLCRQRKVGLLCSLFDLDLTALAPLRGSFEEIGTRVAISSPDVVDICFDKWKTYHWGLALNFDMPKTYLNAEAALDAVSKGELSFPLVVKPRWGTGSIAISSAFDAEDLPAIVRHVKMDIQKSCLTSVEKSKADPTVIIQEMIQGVEYGVDVVNDLNGKYACCFVKKKLGMRSGETDAAITVEDSEIVEKAVLIGNRLRHVGLLDIDIFRDENRIFLLEMNPRFGGHYPFSHLAGADIPAALIAWAQDQEPDPVWLRVIPNVEGCKQILPALVQQK